MRVLLRRLGAALLLPALGLTLLLGQPPAQAVTVAPTTANDLPEFSYLTGDGFDGPLDRSRWTAYTGRPTCCPDTWWDPSRTGTWNGALHVWNSRQANGAWISGGISANKWSSVVRTYGRYEARIRTNAGYGSSPVALLWPTWGWPPEIDYYEFDPRTGDRSQLMMTTHYGTDGGAGHRLSQRFINGDFTQWHTVAVEWTPWRLDYFLDGQLVKAERDWWKIPNRRMFPTFQTHVVRNAAGAMPSNNPDGSNPEMEIDYLKVWAWKG